MDRIERTKATHARLFRTGPEANVKYQDYVDILLRNTFGDVFHLGELPDKTRELITITLLTLQQSLPQLETHIHACINVGVPAFTVREALFQCSSYIGFPKVLNAIQVMDKVFADRGISLLPAEGLVSEEDRLVKGGEIEASLYGDFFADRYKDMPEPFRTELPALIKGMQFGDFYTRPGMDVKTRELLTFCSIAALDLGKQVRIYLDGCKKAGNSIETIYAALVHCIPYIGYPIVLNAINMVLKMEKAEAEE